MRVSVWSPTGWRQSPALITTVDTILPVDDFRHFVHAAAGFASDAVVLGVTSHVDDEKPLWATPDVADGRIRRLGGDSGSHVTAGLYWLPARGSSSLPTGFARLRDYLGWLVERATAGLRRGSASCLRHRPGARRRGGRVGRLSSTARERARMSAGIPAGASTVRRRIRPAASTTMRRSWKRRRGA